MAASNEFEREESRDLQDILLQRLQMSLPLILDNETLKEDLFMLPKDSLDILFSQTETCISDYQLFEILEERLIYLKDKAINES